MVKTLQECYEVLGLDSSAKEDEIKSAYRQKALKCHPDKNPDDPLSTQKFQELGHAYRRLMGEEDSDEDDEDDYGNKDDMELWRDFFFYLFRDEILAKARCQCYRCRRQGDEDDDFLASLAKKEEEQQFTEEEMAQFTSFTNLKEQREANKQKFCNKNLSSSKPEQRASKGHKPKLKSNRELKREQWKREKEITEIAAQIKQNSKVQEKMPSEDFKDNELLPQKSFIQPGDVDPKHSAKEHTGASNKRNTRKKRNRNKSRKQGNQEMDSNQRINHRATQTFAKQKVAPTPVIKDAIRNVTIKPETTKRQDDVTGRFPRHTSFTSPRMMQSSVANSAFSSQKNAFQKQSGKGWFENPRPQAASRASYGANIWEKRQQKQQFLVELQPSNQADEELQLQIALELSKKQAEIDAQQREISILEKQMEETLQIEKELELKSDGKKARSSTAETAETNAAAIDDDFPPLVHEKGSDEEEWMVASGSEDEWDDYGCGDDDDNDSDVCLSKFSDPKEEHPVKLSASKNEISERDNTTVSKPIVELPQHQPRDQNPQASECPYGKNCCLGRRCKYSHPASIDTMKRHKPYDNSSSQDCKVVNRNDDSNSVHKPSGKHGSDTCDSTVNNGCPCSASMSEFDESPSEYSVQDLPKEPPATHISETSAHSDPASNENDDLMNKTADLHSQQPRTDRSSSFQEKNDNKRTVDDITDNDQLEGFKCTSNVLCENAVTEDQTGVAGEKGDSISPLLSPLNQTATTVPQLTNPSFAADALSQSANALPQLTNLSVPSSDVNQYPNSMPQLNNLSVDASALNQSTNTMPQLTSDSVDTSAVNKSTNTMPQLSNLSVDASALDHSPQMSQPVNNAKHLQAAMPANVTPLTSESVPQHSGYTGAIPGNLQATYQNSTSKFGGHVNQTSPTSQQPNTPVSGISTSAAAVNNFSALPGFSFLPFGNLLPANATSFNQTMNTTLMTAGSLGGIARMPLPCHSVQNLQGGVIVPPYFTNQPNCSGLSASCHYVPMPPLGGFPGVAATDKQSGHESAKVTEVASSLPSQPPGMPQMNGVLGMPRTGTPSSLQAGFAINPLSTAQTMLQLKGFLGIANGAEMLQASALQFSQPGLATAPSTSISTPQLPVNGFSGMPVGANMPSTVTSLHSVSPNMPQLLRYPVPMSNPQGFVNMNTEMVTKGIPNLTSQDDSQTAKSPASQVQRSELQEPAEVKLNAEEQNESPIGVATKAPLLRRPATMPKVIQHQVST